jgi:hypothetical protein
MMTANKTMTKLPKLTRSEIWKKVDARESFWCQTHRERAEATNHAKAMRSSYHTGADERGGYSVWALPLLPLPVGAVPKPADKKTK